ncbi:MAG TPA: hypothetical protein VK281_05940 [Xanthobacteraceae bacterium]|nr:hypothetical protein [Xanthobacteraceae bacterium]
MAHLYSLCYRLGGSFEGLVLLDAESMSAAVMRAEVENLDPGGECEAHEISPHDARAIPARFIGRLLGEDEAADLERILVANTPKKQPASSVRVDRPGRRRA